MESAVEQAPFRTRVRYAECNAHGELPLAPYVNYFREAAARALQAVGADLQDLTSKGGVLREGGVSVDVHQSPAYDDEVRVEVGLESLGGSDFTLRLELRRTGRTDPLALGSIRFVARGPVAGTRHGLPPELSSALRRIGHRP